MEAGLNPRELVCPYTKRLGQRERDTSGARSDRRPYEDTARRQPSARQREASQEETELVPTLTLAL